MSIFFRKNSETQSSLRPRKFTKSDFSGLAPIQRVLKGGFSKGGFCRIRCQIQEIRKLSRILGSAVHSTLRAPQSRGAFLCLQKPPSKNPLFLVPEFGTFFDTFLILWARSPGNTLLRHFGDFGPRGPRDSCICGGSNRNPKSHFCVTFWDSKSHFLPSVQMALQIEKNDFRINYAFHSRYRHRQILLIFRSRCRHSCSLQF